MLPKPKRGNFSSGPCIKHPGWSTDLLDGALVGISHRSKSGLSRIQRLLSLLREILFIPKDYVVGIIPGSTTGAVECAIWNLLGPRIVNVLCTDAFSQIWADEIIHQLKLKNTNTIKFSGRANDRIDFKSIPMDQDIVFVPSGTTSGMAIPDFDWISDNRPGLTICDASSAVFTRDLSWSKLDATCFSWQKGLGGESGQGMLVLSPRAVERLNSYNPAWPIPRLYSIKKEGKLNHAIFEGYTINTPSMIAVEDFIDSLTWAKSLGGLSALMDRVNKNYSIIKTWIRGSKFFDFLVVDENFRTKAPICLTITDSVFCNKSAQDQWQSIRDLAKKLEEKAGVRDILGHISCPYPNIRIWSGPTIEAEDIKLMLPWLDLICAETLR